MKKSFQTNKKNSYYNYKWQARKNDEEHESIRFLKRKRKEQDRITQKQKAIRYYMSRIQKLLHYYRNNRDFNIPDKKFQYLEYKPNLLYKWNIVVNEVYSYTYSLSFNVKNEPFIWCTLTYIISNAMYYTRSARYLRNSYYGAYGQFGFHSDEFVFDEFSSSYVTEKIDIYPGRETRILSTKHLSSCLCQLDRLTEYSIEHEPITDFNTIL